MSADSITTSESQGDETPADDTAEARERTSRPMLEALLCLALAVILVRAFAVEGYMISTGSMAPTLPGFHKRATCPKCRYEFAVGTTNDGAGAARVIHKTDFGREPDGESIVTKRMTRFKPNSTHAVCPNCGFTQIDIAPLPKTQGDQLLVFKNAYAFQEPRRWEVVVFRNPSEPLQAYVKRAVGLPGEAIELKQGDVWIDGHRVRKSLKEQKAVRILVFDQNHEPVDDDSWQPRWKPAAGESNGWRRDGFGFQFARPEGGSAKKIDWMEYRHWLRRGGRYRTAKKVPAELQKFDFTEPSLFPLQYDAEQKEISHHGVLTDEQRDQASKVYSDPAFRRFLAKFAAATHISPIVDDYGYNLRNPRRPPIVVRDLMLACHVRFNGGSGTFHSEITDGHERFRLSIDSATRIVALWKVGESKPLHSVRLKADALNEPLRLLLSLFDRQVLVAINDHALFPPVSLKRVPKNLPAPLQPVRFGSDGAGVRVSELKLYRDIYYTRKGTKGVYQLADDEYYVLGDNSPISADSRVWPHSGVSRRLFLGKPFLVHLPSRPGNFQIGGRQLRVRIPDFSRIRYIR